jgi:hypothetical protein
LRAHGARSDQVAAILATGGLDAHSLPAAE